MATHPSISCLQGIQQLNISITDGDTNPPVWSNLTYSSNIDEWVAKPIPPHTNPTVGTVVAVIQALDVNVIPSPVTYTLLDGNYNGVIALDSTTGAATAAHPELISFNARSSYVLTGSARNLGACVCGCLDDDG